MSKVIMVTGGRNFDPANYRMSSMPRTLEPYAETGNVLLVGGARGADELARLAWHYDFQLPYVVVPAPWDRMGKAAGLARNIHMVRGTAISPHLELHPDVVIAFPGGAGTAHAVRQAQERNIEVVRVGRT